jgi:hypothetical protein
LTSDIESVIINLQEETIKLLAIADVKSR